MIATLMLLCASPTFALAVEISGADTPLTTLFQAAVKPTGDTSTAPMPTPLIGEFEFDPALIAANPGDAGEVYFGSGHQLARAKRQAYMCMLIAPMSDLKPGHLTVTFRKSGLGVLSEGDKTTPGTIAFNLDTLDQVAPTAPHLIQFSCVSLNRGARLKDVKAWVGPGLIRLSPEPDARD